RLAFGDFVGYQAGWLVWLANLMTNAAFAVLFADYLQYLVPGLSPAGRYVAALLLIWGTTLLNCFGIRMVGSVSVVLTVLIFLPFAALSLGGILHWTHPPMVPFVHPDKSFAAALTDGLMIALWLYGGYEKLTPNAEEVENPARAFPIALLVAMPMVVGSYFIPTLAGLVACDGWRDWGVAHFSVLAERIGGSPLAFAMTAGGLLSNTCILMVTILGQSRLPMVMAQDRLFPPLFARTSRRFATPTLSLVTGAVLLSLLARENFESLATLFTLVQVLAYVLICAALLRLRKRPEWRAEAGPNRLFRIPLGDRAVFLCMTPVFALTAFVVLQRIRPGGGFTARAIATDLLVFASGPLTYALVRMGLRGAPGTASEPTK
ncbi:MAG TPA: APC family permease, partial [Candidatus Polarisedimenticolia bacterium]|nr:APC family permease [Candidatus Polarisedimenticolia bacterium]